MTLTVAALTLTACTGDNERAAPTASTTSPVAVDGDRAAAAAAAQKILTTWARPDLPHTRWWADLKPLLTEQAQVDYSYTDPAMIPALRITGKPVEAPGPFDPYVTTYYFKTTHGRFGVDLARSPSGGPWRAYSIIFPGGQSQRQ